MPDWKSVVREQFKPLRLNAAAEADLAEEVAQHLEDYYRELRSGGAGHEEAYRKALAELSDMQRLRTGLQREDRMPRYDAVPAGDASKGNVVEDLWRDVRYAGRTMRKSPLFVAFAVATLALGIGANTTVFTVINTLILNPLPIPNWTELGAVSMAQAERASESAAPLPVSYLDLKDYQSRNAVFRSLAGYTAPRVMTWQGAAGSERMFAELVTGNYFDTLGLRPTLGRFFLREDDSAADPRAVAVLNYATWQTRFGGAAGIVGQTMRVNHVALTVIGVAPPGFIGINAIFGPDVWIPAAMAERVLPNEMRAALTDRGKGIFQGVGRFQQGVARTQAQANLAAIAAALAREYPADEGRTATVRPIRDALFGSAAGGSSPILFGGVVLLIVVGMVLAIACSNVANLLLARSAVRRQEMAIRLAMGAGQRRLLRQLLTESLLLGLLSGALGMCAGYGGLRLLWGTLPGSANFIAPKLDATVLVFALVVSLAAGFLFGAVPAFRLSRANVSEALKEARTTGRGRRRVTLANALLIGQVAFSFLLLTTAALFTRSIQRAYEMDPGFQTAHLAVLMTNPGQAGYGKEQTKAFYRELRDRVARIPDVASVSWSSNMPLWARSVSGLEVEGRQQRSRTDRVTAVVNTVDRGFFETAGVTIEKGRAFTDADREGSAPVAIVNERMAHDYWPAGEALGGRIQLPGEKQMRQIIGIARTANYTAWAEAPQRCVYAPLEQNDSDAMVLYVRSKGDPRGVLVPIEREVAAAAPQVLAKDIRTGREIIDGGLYQPRMGVALLSVFGLLALGLASIGLYGIVAYSVNQRTREIGLRMALGAAQSSVLGMVLKQGMSVVLTGVAIGLAAAFVTGRLLSRMLYGVSASDPISVVGAALVLSAVALLACYLPARRASRVDPLAALREG
jgi:predicted permease